MMMIMLNMSFPSPTIINLGTEYMFETYIAGNTVLPQHHLLLKPKFSIKI